MSDILPISKTRTRRTSRREVARVECAAHLKWLRTLPCIASGLYVGQTGHGVVAHHLLFAEPSAMGMRSGDNWAVPVLHELHDAQYSGAIHAPGQREADWWEARNLDVLAIAKRLWAVSIIIGRTRIQTTKWDAAWRLAGDWQTWIARDYERRCVA